MPIKPENLFTKNQKKKRAAEDRPEPGKLYALTGTGPSIANGNSWKESEVDKKGRSVGAAAAAVVEYVKDIEVSTSNYDAFRVHNWTLVIHKTIDGVQKETRRFWLGQDARVCSRILGADSRSLIAAWEEETGNRLKTFDDLKGWLAEKIVEAQNVDVEKIFDEAENWQLAAE